MNANCKKEINRGCCFCRDKETGEVRATACRGCNKLDTYDWLEGIESATTQKDIFEVRFKNTRKGYYRNVNGLQLAQGDIVAVESSPGHDIGIISLTGEMVEMQMRKTGFNPKDVEFRKIYRKAKPYDIEKWQEAIALEHPTMIKSRQIAAELGLNMKIGDVEYQGDKIKAIFYYIADERVDFRELIKILADQFKIRVEMKQIGARQEAGRIGGIGSCGRELCCSTWISNFVSVTTNAARYQEISLNPQKLAGQCSKLKCCLNYEVDSYIDARKELPRLNGPLEAADAQYFHIKTDIFRRVMYFSSDPQSTVNIIALSVDRVKEILRQNRKGIKVEKIEDEADLLSVRAGAEEPDFKNVIGEESITRFDSAGGKRRRGSRNRGGSPRGTKDVAALPKREGESSPREAGGENRPPREGGRGVNRSNGPRPPRGDRPERRSRGSNEGGPARRPERREGDRPENRRNNRPPRPPREKNGTGNNGGNPA